MKKETVLSGIRPTGRLHIGNYLGSLANFVKLQDNYECYFFIADLHSLTELFNPKEKTNQIINLAADFLAAGLDPKKCTIFIQSHVPEHSELAIILSNIIPVAYLFRMTQYKEKAAERSQKQVNSGLLFYPILMAADILIYKSSKIPIGQDQTQHVELARDTARFFNNQFGLTLTPPQPLYTQTPKIMSLVAPTKKMSKSLGDNHCIYIDDEPEVIAEKLAKAPTDIGDAKSPGGKNLLELTKIFCPKEFYNQCLKESQNSQLKYFKLKSKLAESISQYFANYRQKKKELLKHPEKIKPILVRGAKKARKKAKSTLLEIKKKIGLCL